MMDHSANDKEVEGILAPQGESQGEELQTSRPEQQVSVRLAQDIEAGDSITELVDHIN